MADKESATKAATIVFRIAALVLTVVATVVMGTASQLVVVVPDYVGGGHRRWSSYVVSYSHYSALVYFVAAGVIAAFCSAAGLYLSAVNAKLSGAGALVPLLDALGQGFLFSASGAAFAARGDALRGTWAWSGAEAGGRRSVCDAAGAFCGRVTVGAAVGTVAAVAVSLAALASKDGLRNLRRCCDF